MAPKLMKPTIQDIGDFEVRRLLPNARQRSVGPFLFWDHFGPVTLPADANMEVRPHPHIGLATLTWLFDGAITHRDSLGNVQDIRPGAVNWMTAGRGIVHSERTPESLRGQEKPLHGLQLWLGLPDGREEVAPDFQHCPGTEIPVLNLNGVDLQLIAGSVLGAESPVAVYSPLFLLTAEMAAGQTITWQRHHEEEAIYVIEGNLELDKARVGAHSMAMVEGAKDTVIHCLEDARIALFGGTPIGRRHLVWNFVSSSSKRIESAAELWARQGFDPVPGEDEFIPLPDRLKRRNTKSDD